MSETPIAPVRVNPVLRHPAECRLSLDGEWGFRLDPDDRGVQDEWFRSPQVLTETISVPGCWQGQGFGHGGEDEIWDFRLRTQVFRATYTGTGWYARSFVVPDDWEGKRVWLNLGGAHPSAEVWLNGVLLGRNELPFVPFGFEIGERLKRGGPNDLVVRVHEHNRRFGFAYNWQGNWSGLYRGVELTASGETAFGRLRVHPDVDRETMHVSAHVRERPTGAGSTVLRLQVRRDADGVAAASVEVPVEAEETVVDVPVSSPRLWSPDAPDLYRVEAELLVDGRPSDALVERVGFVKLAADGHRFLINGEPYYMRGTGDFLSCPETGCPDTDRDRWRRKLKALRAYGYNYVRCQSYVYAPEYFDAADEVGLLVQSEMGTQGAWSGHSVWHVYPWPQPTPDCRAPLRQQWNLVVERDANHPSANLYCMSNEWGAASPFPRNAWQCYRDTKTIKPTAMVIWTDGGYNESMPGDFVNGDADSIGASACSKPIIQHEFRWWSSFPDVRISDKYSGAVRHYAGELARRAAGARGQERLLGVYAQSSQRLQLLEAKAKMEACRRDHGFLAGICHFDAMDANPSPQGVIDEFYERKLADAETWLRTNGDTVVLSSLGFTDRVLGAGDELRCTLLVSDFSHPSFTAPTIAWSIGSEEGTLGSGAISWEHEAFGTCAAGEIVWRAPATDSPRKLRLAVEMREGERLVRNAWDLWLFPEPGEQAGAVVYGDPEHTWLKAWCLPRASGGELGAGAVAVTERLDDELIAYMRRGGTVLLAASEGLVRPHGPSFMAAAKYYFTPPANYGPYEDGQNGTVVRDHPLLGSFPHEGFGDLQFYRMMVDAPPLDLEPLGLNDEDPVIRVIHRYPVCRPLGYLVERACGGGRLVVSALQCDPAWPEARHLLNSICVHATTAPASRATPLSEAALSRIADATSLP